MTWKDIQFIWPDFAGFNQKLIWKWSQTWHFYAFEISFNYKHKKETIRNCLVPTLAKGYIFRNLQQNSKDLYKQVDDRPKFQVRICFGSFLSTCFTFCQEGCWGKDPKDIKWNYKIQDKVGSTTNLGKLRYLSLFIYCFDWFITLLLVHYVFRNEILK